MAALPHQSPREDDEAAPAPWFSLASILIAALMFGGAAIVTRTYGGNPAGLVAGALVLLAASALLAVPATRGIALLLAWNGLGITLGMLAILIFSVGALVAFPLAMIALALSSWPRGEGESIASHPAIVAAVGGAALVFLLYGALDDVAGSLARLAGFS